MDRYECDCGVVYHNLPELYACQANYHYQAPSDDQVRISYLEDGIQAIASRLLEDVDTAGAGKALMNLVGHEDIRSLAEAEVAAEDFRRLVDSEKERIRTHRSIWERIFPFTITVKRRTI